MKQLLLAFLLCTLFLNYVKSQSFPSLHIATTSSSVLSGDTIEYQFFASNFSRVLGMQWGLSWDTSALKIISTPSSIAASAKAGLGISNQSFNVGSSFIFFSTVTTDLEGITISPGEDSLLFTVRGIALQAGISPQICFSNQKFLSELVFFDEKGNEVSPSGRISNCNEIKFDPNQLILNANAIRLFDQFTQSITLSYRLKNGYPPYHSDWGVAKDADSITIIPPTTDSIFNVKVWDESKDTIFYTYFLQFVRAKITVSFTQEYVTVLDAKKIKLSASYSGNNGKVTVDWGAVKDVPSIIIDPPTKDSTYQVTVFDDSDTVTHTFYIRPYRILSWDAPYLTSIVPYDNEQVGLKIFAKVIGLKPPVVFLCPGASSIDSNAIVVPCDEKTYTVTAIGGDGMTINSNLYTYKVRPTFFIFGQKKLLIDQSNSICYFHPGLFQYKQPFSYLWQNGDTTQFSKIRRPSKDSTYYSLSIVDANGLAVRDSILLTFDLLPRCQAFLGYQNKEVTANFQKNPRLAELSWQYQILQNKVVVQQGKGKTTDELLTIPYENTSLSDTAVFLLRYTMKGNNFNLGEQEVSLKIAPITPLPLQKSIQLDRRFCVLDSAIAIRAGVFGGAPPLSYRWSNGQEGPALDSIMDQPKVTTKYIVTVTDAAGKTITNSIRVFVGDTAKIFPFALADTTCPAVSLPKLSEPFLPFVITSTLSKSNGEFRYDTTSIGAANLPTVHKVKDYNNRIHEQVVLRVKIDTMGYCLVGNNRKTDDTLWLSPTPRFAGRAGVTDSICVGDSILLDPAGADTNNLSSATMRYRHSVWVFDHSQGNTIIEQVYGQDRVQYQSGLKITLDYQNNNNWLLHQFLWTLNYDFNSCVGFDDQRIDSIFTFLPPSINLYSKYQTVTGGQSIQPILITTNAEKLSYEWVYAKNVIEGTALDSRGTLIKGTLTNLGFKPQLVKLLLGAESRTCPTIWDTAYLLVQPKFVPADENFKESNVFQVGSGKFWQVYPEEPSTALTDISLLPNPTLDHLTVNFELQQEQHLAGEIYTLSGKRVKYFTYAAGTGVHQLQLDVADLPQGLYLLRLSGPNYQQTAPFIKE